MKAEILNSTGFNTWSVLVAALLFIVACQPAQEITYLFVGTYTDGKPDSGIYIYAFDVETGELSPKGRGENITNPSFLCLAPNGKYLYAATDTRMKMEGSVSAFKIDSINGQITFLNKQPAAGRNPAHVTVHRNSRYVVSTNYTDAAIAVFKTTSTGSLQPYTQTIPFQDSSIIKRRQRQAHLHSSNFSPDQQYLFAPDLGADKIRVFKFEKESDTPLTIPDELQVLSKPGSGPRHMTFHPSGEFAYCIDELSCTVSAYRYQEGELTPIGRTFACSIQQDTTYYGSADIHVSPDGKYLYASNRHGENTIAIFSVNEADGSLDVVGHQSTHGDHPRSFTIDPTGRFLLVANQNTNNVVIFKRDTSSGLLTKTETEITVSSPSSLKMRTYLRK